MPGTCDGSDLKLALLATRAVATPECPKESYCDERDRLHRRECPPGLCRYGGTEHPKTMPCPDHPWGAPFAAARASREAGTRGAERRSQAVAKLVPAIQSAVEVMHGAILAGSLSPGEISCVQQLQLWLSDLIEEQEVPPAAPAAAKAPKKKK